MNFLNACFLTDFALKSAVGHRVKIKLFKKKKKILNLKIPLKYSTYDFDFQKCFFRFRPPLQTASLRASSDKKDI